MAAATCAAEVPLELGGGGLGEQQDRSDSGTS